MKFTNIINVSLYVVAFVMHCFGFSLLITLEVSPRFTCTQRLYLLHISVCETFGCLLYIIIRALIELEKIDTAVIFYKMSVSGLYTWYIGLMVLMTFDRFLTVYYNITYHLIWTSKKTKALLTVLCVFSLFFGVAVFPMSLLQVNKMVTLYLWPLLDFLFLVVAVVTYGYFFIKIKENRRKSHRMKASSMETIDSNISNSQNSQESSSNSGVSSSTNTSVHHVNHASNATGTLQINNPLSKSWRTKLKKSFYTPTLLVATFVVFWLVPDLINFSNTLLWKYHHDRFITQLMKEILRNFYPIGYISDAIIYIFFQKEVFQFLKKRMRCSRR